MGLEPEIAEQPGGLSRNRRTVRWTVLGRARLRRTDRRRGRGGAYSCHREHEVGTLEPGKLADIIVLDRNLFTVDVEDIPDTKVLLTMVDGGVAYQNS